MKTEKNYEGQIQVQVTKRLPKKDLYSIVQQFVNQKLTFAVSKHATEYEIWRQILPGDQPRVKNRKEGMTPAGVISQDEDLARRNFVCIWDKGKPVYGNLDKI
ncbi:MAG TPA: hypothetical protein PK878_19770 [bacterium]|nr:hypothetical protein [Candidatus Omnitrophota bacterium]HOJ62524.1 hypothetical protein [bacterium]HOL92818.1 hypothetical protein [bacterium]HPP00382.1 hypothetical protein [bacterium]HXK93874.1 hypothetical protein [bacterium]